MISTHNNRGASHHAPILPQERSAPTEQSSTDQIPFERIMERTKFRLRGEVYMKIRPVVLRQGTHHLTMSAYNLEKETLVEVLPDDVVTPAGGNYTQYAKRRSWTIGVAVLPVRDHYVDSDGKPITGVMADGRALVTSPQSFVEIGGDAPKE